MKSNRSWFVRFADRFCEGSQRASSHSLQPRVAGRGCVLVATSIVLFGLISSLTAGSLSATTLGTLSVAPGSANFGSVAVGTKNSQVLQLKNTGGSLVVLSAASISGSGFSMSRLYIPLWMAPGVTMNLTVTFLPTSSGSRTGSITIKSNGSNPTLTIPLSGTGSIATRTLSLSASSLNFGNQMVSGSSTLGVTVKNTGNSSVSISQVGVSGAGFGIGGGFIGATIAAGQSATLNVVFAPTLTGSVTGKVTITSNASNSPNSVATSGTGVSNTAHWVALDWAASTSSGVVGYYVYRSTVSGSSYSRINSSPTAATQYTDGTVSSGKTYYYVVTAVTSNGTESARSSQTTAVIP